MVIIIQLTKIHSLLTHYNPHSNYFKKELQETFEILNLLKTYRKDKMVKADEILKFSVNSNSGKSYSFNFKPLDDILLYLESNSSAVSFYCNDDKRTYGFVDFTDTSGTQPFNLVTNNKTLLEFYTETIDELEKNIKEPCVRETDIYEIIRTLEGKSLNELKTY